MTERGTFLLTDIVGSTEKWAQSLTAMGGDLALHEALVCSLLAEHEGRELRQTHDGLPARDGEHLPRSTGNTS